VAPKEKKNVVKLFNIGVCGEGTGTACVEIKKSANQLNEEKGGGNEKGGKPRREGDCKRVISGKK